MSLWKCISRLSYCKNSFNIIKQCHKQNLEIGLILRGLNNLKINENGIHTSSGRRDLMEFFDDKKNWSELEVRVGRAWKVEELRIKSNSDLHKLWYVLLKERNMLLTMQHEYERKCVSFPNPERLDKVEESMENLETVVRERNRAYYELETGDTGERPTEIATNCFGLKYKYKMKEHLIEKRFNGKFLAYEKLNNHTTDHKYVNNFLLRLEEKKKSIARARKWRQYRVACNLLKIFPHLDEEALASNFPDIDIEAVKRDPRSRGHMEYVY